MKVLSIFHKADLDGLACHAVIERKYKSGVIRGGGVLGYPYQYGEDPSHLIDLALSGQYNLVFMCDVSLSMSDMILLKAKLRNRFVWIDHHWPVINQFRQAGVDCVSPADAQEIGACQLVWTYLNPGKPAPMIIGAFANYDVFNDVPDWWDTVVPAQLAYTSSCLPFNGSVSPIVEGMDDYEFKKAVRRFRPVVEFELSTFEWVKKSALQVTEGMYLVNACGVNPGRFAKYVFDKDDSRDVLTVFYQLPEGNWKYSIRRRKGSSVDVSEIARQYGGGGHPAAAGWVSKTKMF